MQRHIAECEACAEMDARVRRSLLMVRNLPPIDVSPDFHARLEHRLRECRNQPESTACVNFKVMATVGAVASLMMVGYVGMSLRNANRAGMQPDVVMPPVIALAQPPASEASDEGPAIVSAFSPAILASVATGMPIWPAAMFAEQAPLHAEAYRNATYRDAGYVPSPAAYRRASYRDGVYRETH